MANRLITAGSRMGLRFASDERLLDSVRRGDHGAFEVLVERHTGALLSFCVYMLGSPHDAEDAVQTTFAAAYRALTADQRPSLLRPWLFAIARNDCLTILRKRRSWEELNGEPDLRADPFKEVELREEIRHLLACLHELPERQRATLVLAQLHGLSQLEIGEVLGVRAEQVKAYMYQARSQLISDRRARDADCLGIREELSSARGRALLRGRIRRHLRSCAGCRAFADGVSHQHRHLGALLPLTPSLALKARVLEHALGGPALNTATHAGGAAVGGSLLGGVAAVEVAGGGIKALAVKIAAGIACVGACAGVGTSVISEEASRRGSGAGVDAQATPSPPRSGASAGPIPLATPARVGGAAAQSPYKPTRRVHAGPRETRAGSPTPQTSSGPAQASLPPEGAPGASAGGGERSPENREAGPGSAPNTTAPAEERQQKADERQRKREDLQRKREQRFREREERQREREERKREREELHRVGGTGPPPKSKEERQHVREERQREREERSLEHKKH